MERTKHWRMPYSAMRMLSRQNTLVTKFITEALSNSAMCVRTTAVIAGSGNIRPALRGGCIPPMIMSS